MEFKVSTNEVGHLSIPVTSLNLSTIPPVAIIESSHLTATRAWKTSFRQNKTELLLTIHSIQPAQLQHLQIPRIPHPHD
jgi:hypothetical protein